MDTALRPRSPSELVDAAFRLYRRHGAPFLTLSVLTAAPVLLLHLGLALWVGGRVTATSVPDGYLGATFGISAVSALYYAAAVGAFAALADAAALEDGPPSVAAAVRTALARALACLAAALLAYVAMFVGFVFLIVPGIYLAVRMATAIPAVVVERLGPVAAIGRAWERSRGHVWHSLGALLLGVLLVFVPAIAGSMVQGVVVLMLPGTVGVVAGFVVQALVSVLTYPLLPLVTQMLYYDLRVRAEGLDLERMVAELDDAPPALGAAQRV